MYGYYCFNKIENQTALLEKEGWVTGTTKVARCLNKSLSNSSAWNCLNKNFLAGFCNSDTSKNIGDF